MITSMDIETLFSAQLGRIKDTGLRAKVVETWVLGCTEGNWRSVDELKAMPFTLLTDTRGVSFIEHTIAVTEGAWELAQAQIKAYVRMPFEINTDRLVAGALLHDVGKLVEVERTSAGGFQISRSGKCARHPISGAVLAAKVGVPNEVVNVIACHAKEGEGRPMVVETILVHQADFATFDPLVMLNKGQLIQRD